LNQSALPTLLDLAFLFEDEPQLSLLDLAAIKENGQKLLDHVRQNALQKETLVYYLQISGSFYRNHDDILHLIDSISIELVNPREPQMIAFSFAVIWLYREQISLFQELGDLNVIERRSHPESRRTKARAKDLGESAPGT
jgi:hypothetical protein